MKKQKVLLIAAKANMIWQFNQRNMEMLLNLGYEVHVATNFVDFGSFSAEENEILKAWPTAHDIKWHQIDFERRLGTLSGNRQALSQLDDVFTNNEFSFVHVHSPLGGILGRLVAMRHGVKSMYTCHGMHFYRGGSLKDWLVFFPVEWLFALMTHTIVVINQEDEKIARWMPFKNRYRIHGNGSLVKEALAVSSNQKERNRLKIRAEFGVAPDDFMILSVGELSDRKNHVVVLKALSELKKQGIYPKYLIAGVGDLADKLKEKIEELGLTNQVSLLGYRTDIRQLNHAADLFVFPSLREGLGLAGLDAVVDGTYILGGEFGGIKDYIIDHSVGKLINPNNEKQIAELIRERMQKQSDDLSKRAVQELTKFDVSSVDEVMKSAYQQFIVQ